MTDAASTWEWRQVRWQRAIEEIKQNPMIGKGYGGLENACSFHFEEFGRASVDIDLGGRRRPQWIPRERPRLREFPSSFCSSLHTSKSLGAAGAR